MSLKIELINAGSIAKTLTKALRSEVQLLANEVYREVRKNTPVDTGRAKNGWRKKSNDKSMEVSNSVPYVPILDKGRHMTNRGMRGSKQAPKGIVGPSLNSIKGRN